MYKSGHDIGGVWIHPGEPIFDQLSSCVTERFGTDGLKGSVFVDPYATEPYLFHIALVNVIQVDDRRSNDESRMSESAPNDRTVEIRLVGLRQNGDGIHRGVARGAPASAEGSKKLRTGR